MVADAGGVGGETWPCDRQTNAKKFYPIRLFVTIVARWQRMPAVSEVKYGLTTDRRM
jgi:hypothetical protein